MQTATHIQSNTIHPLPVARPIARRAPKPESKMTAMAGMTRDEVRRLVVSLIG